MTPVDTSAEAVAVTVREAVHHAPEYREVTYTAAQLREMFDDDPNSVVIALLNQLEAALRERAEQESLLAERNRANAAAFTASDGYQKRCEQGDALLREARDYAYDYGSEATMAPLVARIDAHLAGEDMGRKS